MLLQGSNFSTWGFPQIDFLNWKRWTANWFRCIRDESKFPLISFETLLKNIDIYEVLFTLPVLFFLNINYCFKTTKLRKQCLFYPYDLAHLLIIHILTLCSENCIKALYVRFSSNDFSKLKTQSRKLLCVFHQN